MKKKKILGVILSCICVLGFLCGCSPSSSAGGIEKPRKTRDNGKPLTIYCSSDTFGIELAVSSYNNLADEECRLEIYEGDANALATEILAGRGPDLFYIHNNSFTDLYSYIAKESFQDLNYYFSKDPVDWSKYCTQITDAGIFNGKRYLLPYSFTLDLYVTTDKRLASCGIPEDIQLVKSDYSNIIGYKEEIEGQGMKLFSKAPYTSLINLLSNYMDYETRESRFDSEEFRRAIELQKEVY